MSTWAQFVDCRLVLCLHKPVMVSASAPVHTISEAISDPYSKMSTTITPQTLSQARCSCGSEAIAGAVAPVESPIPILSSTRKSATAFAADSAADCMDGTSVLCTYIMPGICELRLPPLLEGALCRSAMCCDGRRLFIPSDVPLNADDLSPFARPPPCCPPWWFAWLSDARNGVLEGLTRISMAPERPWVEYIKCVR